MRIVKVKESGNETVSYTYDANGNKKLETLANGVVSTYTYNKANRITKIENKSGDTDISSYEYSYYLDGSDACKVRSESGIIETTSYEYDGLKRLTEEAVKVGNNMTDTYTYEYDDYGNRSKMTAEGTEDYVTEYSYVDSNGKYTALLQKEVKTAEANENLINLNPNSNVKQTVYTYDANGNQITKTADGTTETNTYDGLNQLIGFADGETTASYKYNASGLRYEKTVDGQTINHVWDGNQQIVADVVDNQFYEADCYIRGTNLVAKYNYCNGNKSEYTYYTQNAHGDVVNLTDSTGAVTKTYKYDAFGVEKNIDDGDTNAFRYCGEYFDKETATVYLRARNYNPSTGRFTQRDSLAGNITDPLSLNLYTYCGNNPVLNIDPSGHFFKEIGKGLKKAGNSIVKWGKEFGRDAKTYAKNFVAAQNERGQKLLDDPGLYNFANWMTYGLLDANQQRFNEADDLYGYANWALSGVPDMIKGTFANDRPLSFDHWMNSFGTAGLAFGGYNIVQKKIIVKPSKYEEFFDDNLLKDIKYTDKVLEQATWKDYHGFPECVDAFGSKANISTITGGDGVIRTKIEIPGSYMNKDGVFQYIIEPDDITCNHRLFVPYD